MRKIISVLLTGALTLSLVSFTGCGKDSASKAKDITFDDNGDIVASSGTVINVWTYCDGDEEARTNELCAAFNEKYKEYNIIAKFTPYASSSWETKMKTTLSSSTGPDVFIASDQYYKQWATLGYMENLDPYIESDNESMNMEAEIADMFQGNVGRYLYDVDTTTDDGPNAHYYGLPKGHRCHSNLLQQDIYGECRNQYHLRVRGGNGQLQCPERDFFPEKGIFPV